MANRIKGITVKINGDTTGLDKALKSVNTQITHTQSQLKDVQRLLKLDPSNTELLNQKQQLLTNSIRDTKTKLDTLRTAQAQLSRDEIGSEKYDALQREIIETEQKLEGLTREAGEASSALTQIGETGAALEKVGDKLTAVGTSLTKNVTAPILAIGTAAVKTTADFDAQMSRVSAISGAVGEDFEALREKAREMGATTKFSASEAGSAFEYMAMAGWKTEDMMSGIEGVMALAAASGEELATTSDIVTDALTAFGLKAEDSGHFADVLAAASSSANTNVSMLGESFKYAAPVVGALGGTAEDTSIALGLMANAGIKASQAGTALRTGLTNLTKPSKQMAAYMEKYNIALKYNEDGTMNLRDTMLDLREKMGALTEAEQAEAASAIFGKNAMAGWLAVINASDEDFDKLTSAIDNCDGVAQSMADTMQNNLNGQFTILKSALQELAIQIGDVLMPYIRAAVEKVQGLVEKLQSMDDETRRTVIQIAAFAAATGPALVVIGKLTSAVGIGMQTISKLGTSFATLKLQMETGVGLGGKIAAAVEGISAPMVAAAAAVAALTAAFIYLWNTNEDFRNKIVSIWEEIKGHFEGFAQGIVDRLNDLGFNFKDITEVLQAAWSGLIGILTKLWDGFCQILAPVFEGAFQVISNVLKTALDTITAVFDIFTGLFTGDWEKFWKGIREYYDAMWNGLKMTVENILNTIRGVIEVFWGWIEPYWTKGWDRIKEHFENVWNGVKEFFRGIWESIEKTVWGYIDNIVGAYETLKSKIDGIFESIKNAFDSVKSTVKGIVDSIKDAFDFEWELPKIKLPHFSIEGEFSLDPPTVPKINIDWYSKAMNSGMILNGATIFGAMGNKLLGGGEAGSETVVGTGSLLSMIQQAVAGQQNTMTAEMIRMVEYAAAINNGVTALNSMAAQIESLTAAISGESAYQSAALGTLNANAQAEISAIGAIGKQYSGVMSGLDSIRQNGVPISNRAAFMQQVADGVDGILGGKAVRRLRGV